MADKLDDADIIDFFKNFEEILTRDKSGLDLSLLIDFQVYSRYLIRDIREMQTELNDADDEYLYYACEHIFNIQDWIRLIVEDAGRLKFGTTWESLFEKEFSDRYLLQNMYDSCFEKWISGKTGQYKIGENFYNIMNGKLYYRNRFGEWFEVERATAFDLKPDKELIKDKNLIGQLDREYKETWYDATLKQWTNNKYQGVLPENFLQFGENETSPDDYFNFSITQIQGLLKNPVSIEELERWNGGRIADFEHMLKVAAFVLETARKRRVENSHTLYLLRDSLMFQEAHKLLDILDGKDTSSDQVLVGRKLLSHKPGQWGHYIVMLDALYTAHMRYPTDFIEFYKEFTRLLDMFVDLNPKFAVIVANLADYIKEHIQTDKSRIDIFDIGFQGSIALLTKYIIDRHIDTLGPNGKKETDVRIGIGAQWSKEMFCYRYDGDYFPMLNRVQQMARSDELYQYIDGSLEAGQLRVIMGDKEAQRKAAVELVVLVMVAQIV